MRRHDREIFLKMIRGRVSFNEHLLKHTTIKVGGPAEVWIEPADIVELRLILKYACDNGVPVFVIGNGSNLIVNDEGIKGFVVKLCSDEFKHIEIVNDTVVAGAGVSLPVLIENMKEAGLSGLEPLVGIPGTLGGALFMNAGVKDRRIGDLVRGISYIERDGSISAMEQEDLGLRYRGCDGIKDSIVLNIVFKLQPQESHKIEEKMNYYREQREKSQPRGHSAGCIFRNPERDAAGHVIDRLGFKGERVGGAVVSDVHANFILNENAATASDVMDLIRRIRARALQAGFVLEPEVRII